MSALSQRRKTPRQFPLVCISSIFQTPFVGSPRKNGDETTHYEKIFSFLSALPTPSPLVFLQAQCFGRFAGVLHMTVSETGKCTGIRNLHQAQAYGSETCPSVVCVCVSVCACACASACACVCLKARSWHWCLSQLLAILHFGTVSLTELGVR